MARGKISNIIRRYRKEQRRGQSNLTPDEIAAMRAIARDDNIVIVPADKGNATVVMRKEDYVEKGLAVIQKRPFARMDKCPARRLERTLNAYLWSLCQQRRITKPLV